MKLEGTAPFILSPLIITFIGCGSLLCILVLNEGPSGTLQNFLLSPLALNMNSGGQFAASFHTELHSTKTVLLEDTCHCHAKRRLSELPTNPEVWPKVMPKTI